MTALSSNFYFPPSRLNYLVQLRSLLTQKKIVAIEGGIGIGKTVLLEEVLTTSMPEANKCYVTAGKNITDVQIRSRVIEQLFGNVLFDPEKPLVTSFLEFNQQTELMVAIDNAHFLSAKIIGEWLQVFSQLNSAGIQLSVVMSFDRSISSTLLNINSQIIAVESVPRLSKDESYQLLSTYFPDLPLASDNKVKRWIDNAKGVPIQLLAYQGATDFEVSQGGLNIRLWGAVVICASLLLAISIYAYNIGYFSSTTDTIADDGDDVVNQVVNANKPLDVGLYNEEKVKTVRPAKAELATAADIFLVIESHAQAVVDAKAEDEGQPTELEPVSESTKGESQRQAQLEHKQRLSNEAQNVLQAHVETVDDAQTQAKPDVASVSAITKVTEQTARSRIVSTESESPLVELPESNYHIDNDTFLSLPADRYVLQFTAVSTQKTLVEYLSSTKVAPQDFRIYQIKRNDTDWIVVTYGLYDSIDAARADARRLEPNAWAKSVAVIQQQIRAYQQSFETIE